MSAWCVRFRLALLVRGSWQSKQNLLFVFHKVPLLLASSKIEWVLKKNKANGWRLLAPKQSWMLFMVKSRVRKQERFMTACGVKSRLVISVNSLLPTIKAESGTEKIRKARLFHCGRFLRTGGTTKPQCASEFTCNSVHVNSILCGK